MKTQRVSGETIHKILFYAGAMLVSLIVIGGSAAAFLHFLAPKAPRAQNGQIDLRGWDFSASAAVSLGGEWLFIPQRLLDQTEFAANAAAVIIRNVPDTRFSAKKVGDTGTGTYRLSVRVRPRQRLAIRYSSVLTAFQIEANGRPIAQSGVPSIDPDAARPAYRPAIVPIQADDSGAIDLVVRVSNHEYRWGGIAKPFLLGEEAALAAEKQAGDSNLILVIGALAGVAGNAFFIFVFRKKERAYLYFSIFAVLVAVRALSTGDGLLAAFFPGIRFDTLVRIEYASLFFLVPSAALFFSHLFPEDIGKKQLILLVSPSMAFGSLLPFASVLVLSWSIVPYAMIAMISVVYGFVVGCVRPAQRRRAGSGIVLTAGILLFVVSISGAAYGVFVLHTESGFPMGLPLFVIAQTLALAKRFTTAFDTVETLSGRLANEITIATDTRRKLEVAVAEKDILLQEVHHRVKNSLQIITSIINMQVHRTKDPAALDAYQSVSNRIRAISSVHDKLYGIDSEQQISVKAYAADLVRQFSETYGEGKFDIDLRSEDITVPMDLCIDLGLVLSELIVNAYRHAIIPSGDGTIRIAISRTDSEILVSVADDGPGFPSGFVPGSTDSVGFKVVMSLLRKRSGLLHVSTGRGAVVTVRVPYAAEKAA